MKTYSQLLGKLCDKDPKVRRVTRRMLRGALLFRVVFEIDGVPVVNKEKFNDNDEFLWKALHQGWLDCEITLNSVEILNGLDMNTAIRQLFRDVGQYLGSLRRLCAKYPDQISEVGQQEWHLDLRKDKTQPNPEKITRGWAAS